MEPKKEFWKLLLLGLVGIVGMAWGVVLFLLFFAANQPLHAPDAAFLALVLTVAASVMLWSYFRVRARRISVFVGALGLVLGIWALVSLVEFLRANVDSDDMVVALLLLGVGVCSLCKCLWLLDEGSSRR